MASSRDLYPPGSLRLDLPDGAPIRLNLDRSIQFQQTLLGDIRQAYKDGVPGTSIQDPWDRTKTLTPWELFDQQARLMLVIKEVEERACEKHETKTI